MMKSPDSKYKQIFIVGMPFSGKSSAGKKLASKLKWEWMDSDKELEKIHAMSIPEIFAKKGELLFRQWEKEWLEQHLEGEKRVISTGGGLPVFYNNMERMLEKGLVVFLNTSVPVLADRSLLNIDRPMFKNLSTNAEERRTFLNQLRFDRIPFYGKAHLTVNSERELLEKVPELLGIH